MTGLGEEVYTPAPDGVADVERMVEEAARAIQGSTEQCADELFWSTPCTGAEMFRIEARAALESLGVDLAVLAAVKRGEWRCVPVHADAAMVLAADNWTATTAQSIQAAIAAAPKTPEARAMSEVAELAMKLRGLCDPLSERMPDYQRVNLFVGYGAEAADALEALARENAELRDDANESAGNTRHALHQADILRAQLAAMTSVVEAARGIQRAEAAKDQKEWVACHDALYSALAKLEAANV